MDFSNRTGFFFSFIMKISEVVNGMQIFLRKEGWAYLLKNRIKLVLQQTCILYSQIKTMSISKEI
jgi:hypothetical protein